MMLQRDRFDRLTADTANDDHPVYQMVDAAYSPRDQMHIRRLHQSYDVSAGRQRQFLTRLFSEQRRQRKAAIQIYAHQCSFARYGLHDRGQVVPGTGRKNGSAEKDHILGADAHMDFGCSLWQDRNHRCERGGTHDYSSEVIGNGADSTGLDSFHAEDSSGGKAGWTAEHFLDRPGLDDSSSVQDEYVFSQ